MPRTKPIRCAVCQSPTQDKPHCYGSKSRRSLSNDVVGLPFCTTTCLKEWTERVAPSILIECPNCFRFADDSGDKDGIQTCRFCEHVYHKLKGHRCSTKRALVWSIRQAKDIQAGQSPA